MTTSSVADRRMLVGLFIVGLVWQAAVASVIRQPGYMDAEYYLATARQLVQGAGFEEPFLWNYLADPAGLPTPSHAYWQPLASVVGALPMRILGTDFQAAQVTSVLLAAWLAPLAAQLAFTLGATRKEAWLAGALALFPGLLAPYLVTTDTFGLYAVIGGLIFWRLADAAPAARRRWFLLGALVGLAQLTRADGFLLGLPVAIALLSGPRRPWRSVGAAVGGFAVIVLPWWARNLQTFGTFGGPGVVHTLWLLDYNELFSYPAQGLTFQRWWQAGLPLLVRHRLDSALAQAQTVLAVNGYVGLFPMLVVGAAARIDRPLLRAAAGYVLGLLVLMTLVFPFAGARGGFFHSSAALMPLVWALMAIGVGRSVPFLVRRLDWDPAKTFRLLAWLAVTLAAGLSLWSVAGKSGRLGLDGSFARNQAVYGEVGASLRSIADAGTRVAVNDPPGFYLATGLQAVVIPDGPEDVLRDVVRRYGVEWVVLEAGHPDGLRSLYADPGARDWLGPPQRFEDPAGAPVYLFPVTGS